MPVVLTGDVHQRIASSDRRHATESEARLSVEYARIAARQGVKVTLFVTGLALRESPDDARPLRSLETVEIGGHGWDAFKPGWLYRPLAKASGSPHGFRRWQRRGIRRTCAAVAKITGTAPRSWRNHAYLHDESTPGLLAEAGVVAWSDVVDPTRSRPYVHESGVVVLPLNTTPDHENLYHGDRTPTTVRGAPSLQPHEWVRRVLVETELIVNAGGTATILAHPLCMKVADNWESFDALCSGLAGHENLFATEAAERALVRP
jgi:peptidoglycan/xylan/chitin deacetylase (PgdA/CDA1 family)